MILPKTFFLGLLLSILFQPARTCVQTNHSYSLADAIVNKMAIEGRLNEVPEAIKSQFEQNPLQLPEEKNERMLQLFDKAYDTQLLLNDFKTVIQQKLSGRQANAISNWLQSKQSGAITEARQEYYTLQGKRKRIMAMYEMDQKQPGKERTDLITSLADTTAEAKSTVESSVIIMRSVMNVLNRLSEQRNFSESQIDGIVDNFKQQLQAQASRQTENRLMITYYNIKLPVLENYLTFVQTDAGQRLHTAIEGSMQAAYQSAAGRFLQSVNSNP